MNPNPSPGPIARGISSTGGVRPSICDPNERNAIGQCFDSNGPVPGKFNCQACCAFHNATGWYNPITQAVTQC